MELTDNHIRDWKRWMRENPDKHMTDDYACGGCFCAMGALFSVVDPRYTELCNALASRLERRVGAEIRKRVFSESEIVAINDASEDFGPVLAYLEKHGL